MTSPRHTPNTATQTRPEQSSQRTAHQPAPLAWLPWALLLALLAVLGLAVFLIAVTS